MVNILITGATGNVGRAIIHSAKTLDLKVYAGVRNPTKIKCDPCYKDVEPIQFDFSSLDPNTIPTDIDVCFLMRPPQIADPNAFIETIDLLKARGIHIIFLSIFDAEKKEFTPHRKIEHIIMNSGATYTFIRPSYFMDNLVTTLGDEIQKNRRIYMPSGKLKFSWIDVADIGEAIATIARDHLKYENRGIELSGCEILNFGEVSSVIKDTLDIEIKYKSPFIVSFVAYMLKKKVKFGYILVLLLLHWLPKFERPPKLSDNFEKIVGRKPNALSDFLKRHESFFKAKFNTGVMEAACER